MVEVAVLRGEPPNGSGYGDGSGYGYGDGYGYGSGDGDGDGYGSGDGYGYGDGCGDGIMSFDGNETHCIDGVPTLIYSVKANVAKAAVINSDLTLQACYVVRVGNCFAHGSTIQQAQADAQRKHMQSIPVDQRIAEFNQAFPLHSEKYPTRLFYDWHSILTGSCAFGKESFVRDRGIDLEGRMTVTEFINLTKDQYGREIIKKLAQ